MFLIFLTALGFFAVENKDAIIIKIPFGSAYEMPKIALILLSTTIGALTILIIFFIRDTKKAIENIQFHRRQKRDEKIQNSYAKALNALLGNRDDDAKEYLLDILKENPDHIDSLLKLGDISIKKNDYESALNYYKKAKNISPSNLQVLFSLEALMEKMNRYDDALSYIEDILDIDSENIAALYKKRLILERKENWDELISLQKNIIKLIEEKDKPAEEQKLKGYKYEYGRSSLENGEIEKAEKAFRAVLKIDSTFIPAYFGLVEVLLTKGETEEAINLLEKSYEQLKSVIILARLEDLLINVGEPGRLIRFYKNILSKNPQDYGLAFLMGKLYYRLEMVDDAIEVLNSIDTNVFSVAELFILKGELYLKRNQIAKSLEEYRKSCNIRQQLLLPYCCFSCGFKSKEWSGRCPQCFEWNTYRLDIYGACKA